MTTQEDARGAEESATRIANTNPLKPGRSGRARRESRSYWRYRARLSEGELGAALEECERLQKIVRDLEYRHNETKPAFNATVEENQKLKASVEDLARRLVENKADLDEKLAAEIERLKKQPSDLLSGCAVTLNAILVDWPRHGDKASKKRLTELRDRCEKWGKGEDA